jgi:branched-chain amino acid transport system ATP-binding protein
MSDALLRTRNLDAGYGGHPVVRSLDLEVHAGEVVCLLGPNGAGKTTTVLTIAGELPVVRGHVELFGRPCTDRLFRRVRRGLGFVGEDRSVLMSLTARDNIRLRGGSVERALDLFPELEPHLARRVALLSGGQQQMVGIARALSRRPKLLIVDELSTGLAPKVVQRLLATVSAAAADGVGVLLIEQHVAKALDVAHRCYVLRHGEVVLERTAADLRGRTDELRSAYFGDDAEPAGALSVRSNGSNPS